MIDDFSSYQLLVAPAGSWVIGCTSYVPDTQIDPPQEKNTGVIVDNYLDYPNGNFLTLMCDIFGEPGSYGEFETGYSYAQIGFTASTQGVIKFDYYHVGWDIYPNPSYILGFWLNPDKSGGNIKTVDISSADWQNNVYTNDELITCSIPVTAGQYKLSWKVNKDLDFVEDEILIDNIRFEFTP
jgi:hypothetical protein